MTPIKAIRAKCLDCCCGQFKAVRLCTCEKCPLYPYRYGKRPKASNDPGEGANIEKTSDSPHFFQAEEA